MKKLSMVIVRFHKPSTKNVFRWTQFTIKQHTQEILRWKLLTTIMKLSYSSCRKCYFSSLAYFYSVILAHSHLLFGYSTFTIPMKCLLNVCLIARPNILCISIVCIVCNMNAKMHIITTIRNFVPNDCP